MTYKLTAKNTGNVTLHNVTLTDDPSLDGYTCTPTPPATFAPGDSVVCTGTHTITQGDLDNGSFKDTAKGTSDEAPPDQADDTITADQQPKLKLEKSASPLSLCRRHDDQLHVPRHEHGERELRRPDHGERRQDDSDVPGRRSRIGLTTTCTATTRRRRPDVANGSITNTAQAHANGTDSNYAQATVTAQSLTTEQNSSRTTRRTWAASRQRPREP